MHSTLALCQVRRGVHDEKGLMTPAEESRESWTWALGQDLLLKLISGLGRL